MHRQSTPLLVPTNGRGMPEPLRRLPLQDTSLYDERWVQELVHHSPSVLPINSVEFCFLAGDPGVHGAAASVGLSGQPAERLVDAADQDVAEPGGERSPRQVEESADPLEADLGERLHRLRGEPQRRRRQGRQGRPRLPRRHQRGVAMMCDAPPEPLFGGAV